MNVSKASKALHAFPPSHDEAAALGRMISLRSISRKGKAATIWREKRDFFQAELPGTFIPGRPLGRDVRAARPTFPSTWNTSRMTGNSGPLTRNTLPLAGNSVPVDGNSDPAGRNSVPVGRNRGPRCGNSGPGHRNTFPSRGNSFPATGTLFFPLGPWFRGIGQGFPAGGRCSRAAGTSFCRGKKPSSRSGAWISAVRQGIRRSGTDRRGARAGRGPHRGAVSASPCPPCGGCRPADCRLC